MPSDTFKLQGLAQKGRWDLWDMEHIVVWTDTNIKSRFKLWDLNPDSSAFLGPSMFLICCLESVHSGNLLNHFLVALVIFRRRQKPLLREFSCNWITFTFSGVIIKNSFPPLPLLGFLVPAVGLRVGVSPGPTGHCVVVLLEGLEKASSLTGLLGDLCHSLDNRAASPLLLNTGATTARVQRNWSCNEI